MARIRYNNNKDEQTIRKQEAEIKLLEINNELKKKMFYFVKRFLICYTITSMTITILCGCKVLKLSDPIIITILTTTFIEIIALPKLICKHLFPTNK